MCANRHFTGVTVTFYRCFGRFTGFRDGQGERRVCKLILSEDYTDIQEALKRLNILSFDQVIFLNNAKLMYKIYNNIAPVYLDELFQMRDINLDNTTSFKVSST